MAEPLGELAHQRFDADLQFTHEGTRGGLADLLERFRRWIGREASSRAELGRRLAQDQEHAAGILEPPKR